MAKKPEVKIIKEVKVEEPRQAEPSIELCPKCKAPLKQTATRGTEKDYICNNCDKKFTR
jgi:ribosomal protein L37AE/L43A